MRIRFVLLAAFSLMAFMATGQPAVVHWTGKLVPSDVRAGESAQLILTAKIDAPYHIYSLTTPPEGVPTSFEIKAKGVVSAFGKTIEPKPHQKPDAVGVIRGMFDKEVSFGIPVMIERNIAGPQKLVVSATSQACDAKVCLPAFPVDVPIVFTVAPGPVRDDRTPIIDQVPEQPAGYVAPEEEPAKGADGSPVDETQADIQKAREGGLLQYILLAFTAGLLALVTPCVFPMIPVTVSFFSKKNTEGEKKVNYRDAVAYCVGIIGTFTLLGLVVTLVFGSTGVQDLATNPWVNLAMFALFVFLALNLFGIVELRMPSGLVNKAHQGSRKGGLSGPLLMGLTFSLTTFTCTVPFVGTLLAAAAQGDILYPTLGMAAFSSAFALPFFLLALFPQYLAKMPKSGGWLSTVKAFMGFLELVAAVKFLSSAELAFNLGWITRSVFLALWAAILAVCALYTMGWIRLGHEEAGGKIGWVRRGFGLATVAAVVWCFAGIQGRSLGLFDSFAPPDPYPGTASGATAHGSIPWLESYDQALAQAKTEGKPVFINFTGVNCSNCRWMERNMFPRESISGEMKNFVPVELYTDRPMDKERQALQKKLVGVALNPTYVLVSPEGKVLKVHQGLETDEAKFLAFMKSATSGK